MSCAVESSPVLRVLEEAKARAARAHAYWVQSCFRRVTLKCNGGYMYPPLGSERPSEGGVRSEPRTEQERGGGLGRIKAKIFLQFSRACGAKRREK